MTERKPATTVHSVAWPLEMHAKLQRIAKEKERSFNWIVIRMVREKLKEYEEYNDVSQVQKGKDA